MNYNQAVDYINGLQLHKIKLGLGAMQSFLQKVGNPQERLRFIHVAGTNGKGSVCSALVSVYQQAGYKVGLYTSPHLYDIRERFRINDSYISKEQFAALTEKIQSALGEEKITYFECTTALALLWFADQQPDLVVLETGLGGRLDATNVVTPLVSVITNVSLDHEAYLGNTIEQVAGEKAGIVKPGVPVISGCEGAAASVVGRTCSERGSECFQLGQAFTVSPKGDLWDYLSETKQCGTAVRKLTSNLKGHHQAYNMSLVVAVASVLQQFDLAVSEEHIRNGIKTVFWPGRQEAFVVSRGEKTISYLLDGGHNPAGISSLRNTLAYEYRNRKIHLVWAAMADKDKDGTLPELAPLCEKIYLTRPESERSATPESIYERLAENMQERAVVIEDVAAAMEMAEKKSGSDTLVVVAGSLYLVGMVRFLLLGSLVED